MSLHLDADVGAIAETVLLPGDPLRARYVAETFLEQPEQHNRRRGMLGFTGHYRGHRVSVQGTGMGMPSALIYAHELVRDYGVRNLVRIGSAGSLRPDLPVRSLVVAMSACTDSHINRLRFGGADFAPTADYELLQCAVTAAAALQVPVRVGSVVTSDEFYQDDDNHWGQWAEYGVLCAEMETAALYTVAARYGVRAVSLLTISDSIATGDSVPPDERERGFGQMVQVALSMLPRLPASGGETRARGEQPEMSDTGNGGIG